MRIFQISWTGNATNKKGQTQWQLCHHLPPSVNAYLPDVLRTGTIRYSDHCQSDFVKRHDYNK